MYTVYIYMYINDVDDVDDVDVHFSCIVLVCGGIVSNLRP